jgi:hypothetical protein
MGISVGLLRKVVRGPRTVGSDFPRSYSSGPSIPRLSSPVHAPVETQVHIQPRTKGSLADWRPIRTIRGNRGCSQSLLCSSRRYHESMTRILGQWDVWILIYKLLHRTENQTYPCKWPLLPRSHPQQSRRRLMHLIDSSVRRVGGFEDWSRGDWEIKWSCSVCFECPVSTADPSRVGPCCGRWRPVRWWCWS